MPVALRLLGLMLLAVLALALSLRLGSLTIGWTDLLDALRGQAAPLTDRILWDLRLPRSLTAFCVGGLLAMAGTLQQVLLRNPLADPYILGTAGGAAAGALLAMLAGLGGYALSAAAFVGAFGSTLLVFGLARGVGGSTRLLLTGVVVAAGWGALIAFLLSISPDRSLRGMLFWLMGDLHGGDWPTLALVLLPLALLLAWRLARSLDLLAQGELQAASLGVDVARLRLGVFALSSLTTAAAVTLAGPIGFVGLIVPHAIRLLGLRTHRLLLPGAALAGGALLVLADTAARTLWAPEQLPVGVLTAFIGVPVFLFLLQHQAGRSRT